MRGRRLFTAALFAFVVALITCSIIVFRMSARRASAHPYFTSIARPIVIAHRGGARLRPENTLPAFAHAAELGVDVLELDVRRTKDGALVVIHDPTIDRTTDGAGAVGSYTLAELRQFDAGFRFTTLDASDFLYRGRGVRIPTLDEVFAAHTSARFVVEIKSGELSDLPAQLCETIRAHGMTQKTLVASVDADLLEGFRRACPEVATSAHADEARDFLALGYTKLAATYSPAFHALQVPPVIGGGVPVVTRGFVKAAHERNLQVHPWTINDADEMRRLLDIGVDGIITDRPDVLLDILRERGTTK